MNDARTEDTPLAIVAGGGSLPVAVAEAAMRRGRRVVLFPVRGWADEAAVEGFPRHWLALGQAGRFIRLARQESCRDIVFIGTAARPRLRSIRIDWETVRNLPSIWRAFRGGDDHLISNVARMFGSYGFRIVAPHEVAPEILVPEGSIGSLAPAKRDHADIARGLDLLRAMGPFDVGQAAVVAANHVLAVEAAEGTDGMLSRIVELREHGRISTPAGVGVLVKAPKPGQDRRFDLPAIGPRTIAAAKSAGLAGVAVVAGSTIIAEAERVARAADEAGIFVYGISDRPQ